jgi:hypothetical protein
MHKSFNYIHSTMGGATSLGSAQQDGLIPRFNLKKCKNGKHKWTNRKWERRCTRCGLLQTKDSLGNPEADGGGE